MPGRGRGRGRGGRGGGRGGLKNFGRFRSNNSKKRKSKGTSNNHRQPPPPRDGFPELMDLSDNVFIPEYGTAVPKSNMKNLARRTRSMMSEAMYTDSHMDETLKLPMRKRPVEFVKAKETYDPSKELTKKLEKVLLEDARLKEEKDIEEQDEYDAEAEIAEEDEEMEEEVGEEEEMTDVKIEEEETAVEEGKEVEEEEVGEEAESQAETQAEEEEQENKSTEYAPNYAADDPHKRKTTKGVDFVIDEAGDPRVDTSSIPKLKTILITEAPQNIEVDDVLTIGKVSLQLKRNGQGEVETDLMSIEHLDEVAKPGFGFVTQESSDESDTELAYNEYVNRIMNQMKDNDDYSDVYESDTNFDIMASSSEEEEQEQDDSEDESKDPEYGFLEEDYDFDISKISITNVRLGVTNQYFTTCADLTGDSEPIWLAEDDIVDYILSNGVKEHRVDSFLKFLTKDLIEEEEQPDYSDVYISETSEDDFEEEEEEEEEEEMDYGDNIEDLISFAKNKPHAPELIDFEPTRSIKTKGKGKNKQLNLDDVEMDHELRQYLQQQFQNLRQTKKLRKEEKEKKRTEDGIARHDLFVKYPYTLHIQDIKAELQALYQDESRERVKFPPLDPHGNKTVKKMSELFNFKTKRCGNKGLNMFTEVYKYKRTYKYLPDNNGIYAMTKQRPIFHRTDQKRPKDAIVETDGNKDKDRRRGRNKDFTTTYREGDIVGEKAPEIDANNIGRKLLERMGWSKGEGLGAEGNKGINEPVLAKVKKSKLGLK